MCEEKGVCSCVFLCAAHEKSKPHIKKADNALKTNMVYVLKKDRHRSKQEVPD